jgi:hypothetical protein
VSENKKSSWTLRVLLLACAGALLVIVLSLAGTVYDASQVAHATRQAEDSCGMPARVSVFLPANCQPQPQMELR